MKQSKLRRRRVWRYAVLYFVMLVIFLVLLVGPILAGGTINTVTSSLTKSLGNGLIQPNYGNGTNNNTGPLYVNSTASASAAATSTALARLVKLF